MQKSISQTASNSRKPYVAPRLYTLDHRGTESGAAGAFSDANETIVNVGVANSSAPS